MIFKEEKNEYYPVWYISDCRSVVMAINNELFQRKKIQIMFRDNSMEFGFSVVKEYVTYDIDVLQHFILVLKKSLEELKNLKNWKELLIFLPAIEEKYLEDNEYYKKYLDEEKRKKLYKALYGYGVKEITKEQFIKGLSSFTTES